MQEEMLVFIEDYVEGFAEEFGYGYEGMDPEDGESD